MLVQIINLMAKTKPQNTLKIFILILFAIFFSCFIYFGWYELFNFETLKNNQVLLESFINNNYFITVILFIILYILAVVLQIPSASVLTLAGGLLFGLIGVIYVNIAATIGATLSFLLSRYLFQEIAKNKFKKQLQVVNLELNESALSYLFFLRLAPVLPFFVVNILLALTNTKLIKFIWTTSVGIFPGSLVYVYVGTQIAGLNKISDIVSPSVFAALALLGLLSVIPIILKKFRQLNAKEFK